MAKLKETDIAKKLIDSFAGTGYEIFQEVTTPNGSADIVLRYGFTWAIEVKLGMSLTVLAQARYNLRYFNYSSICIPGKAINGKTFNFGREICKEWGIGIFIVPAHNEVRELLTAKIQRNVLKKHITLIDAQKTFAEAGNSDGKRWTPFAQTVESLKYYIKNNPGCRLKIALQEIDHHYSSLSSAQSSIRQWVNDGVIKGIVINRGICNLIDLEKHEKTK
jgi:hypothetical protein